jgi:hypothetical protein
LVLPGFGESGDELDFTTEDTEYTEKKEKITQRRRDSLKRVRSCYLVAAICYPEIQFVRLKIPT